MRTANAGEASVPILPKVEVGEGVVSTEKPREHLCALMIESILTKTEIE